MKLVYILLGLLIALTGSAQTKTVVENADSYRLESDFGGFHLGCSKDEALALAQSRISKDGASLAGPDISKAGEEEVYKYWKVLFKDSTWCELHFRNGRLICISILFPFKDMFSDKPEARKTYREWEISLVKKYGIAMPFDYNPTEYPLVESWNKIPNTNGMGMAIHFIAIKGREPGGQINIYHSALIGEYQSVIAKQAKAIEDAKIAREQKRVEAEENCKSLVGAFGLELGKPLDEQRCNIIRSKDNYVEFDPTLKFRDFDFYTLDLTDDGKIATISATQKFRTSAVANQEFETVKNLIGEKYWGLVRSTGNDYAIFGVNRDKCIFVTTGLDEDGRWRVTLTYQDVKLAEKVKASGLQREKNRTNKNSF